MSHLQLRITRLANCYTGDWQQQYCLWRQRKGVQRASLCFFSGQISVNRPGVQGSKGKGPLTLLLSFTDHVQGRWNSRISCSSDHSSLPWSVSICYRGWLTSYKQEREQRESDTEFNKLGSMSLFAPPGSCSFAPHWAI